jgi:hypothetical protein
MERLCTYGHISKRTFIQNDIAGEVKVYCYISISFRALDVPLSSECAIIVKG